MASVPSNAKIIRQLSLTVTAQCPRRQVFRTGCLIKGGQLKAQSCCVRSLDPGFASGLEVALQPFVPEGSDHAIYSILYRYKIQSLS
jgi:hypothetical protein